MEVTTIQHKRCDVIKATGRVDSYTSPDLEKSMNTITEAGRYKIVFDMSEVDFMSSKGWWVLIETQKKCKRYKPTKHHKTLMIISKTISINTAHKKNLLIP